MSEERSKIMDDLIAQDADLIDIEVTDEDREVFIRLSGPDDETAQRIRRGLIYTWEVRQIATHRQKAAEYWYRQGKDDGWQMCRENEIDRLREELAEAYIKLSGKSIHTSDCATSNAPAMEPGPCNCAALAGDSHDQ